MLATAYQRITRNRVTQPLAERLSLALMLVTTIILTAGAGILLDLVMTSGLCAGGGSSGCGV